MKTPQHSLDAVAIRYTARLSGVDSICVMLLDVLSGAEDDGYGGLVVEANP